ncbi:MAG: hypothetical protein GDA48_04905 [Hormoscilla sp. GM102CHS1]|nr:hypothetical protein [Hormoscilla sp. GM102CHS1]
MNREKLASQQTYALAMAALLYEEAQASTRRVPDGVVEAISASKASCW